MIPPNPDDSDRLWKFTDRHISADSISLPVLPSHSHPSYPYGDPTSLKHPSARPRPPYDPASRALFEDMGYDGGGVNGSLRWRDIGLNELLPVDEAREEVKKATLARKMASGAASNNNPQQEQPQQPVAMPGQALEDGGYDEDESEYSDDDEQTEEEGE